MANSGLNHFMGTSSSGHSWFWRNYDACMQWQDQHKVAYWKSKALALEYERNALLQYLRNIEAANNDIHGPKTSGNSSFQEANLKSNGHRPRKRSNGQRDKKKKRLRTCARKENSSWNCKHDANYATKEESVDLDPGNESNTDPNVEIELLEFFKQSMRHKMELRERRKASEESDSTDSYSFNKKPISARYEEMKLLYGKNSAMIQGMETAMQLSFERNSDILNPVLWPILPLKM